MALTYLLSHDNQLKELFSTIPNLKILFSCSDGSEAFPTKPSIVVQRENRATSIIGHAYDYMLRAYVQRINNLHQEQQGNSLAASVAVHIIGQDSIHEAFSEIVSRRNAYITGQSTLTEEVINDSVILGQLEQFYRSGSGDPANLLRTNSEDVYDLIALVQATARFSESFQDKDGILCNPRFGEAVTALVDGADGDLIVGDTLIDIKTESQFRWKIGQSRQLIAYWILSCLSPNFPSQIKRLAVWNPRYCKLVSIDIFDICKTMDMIRFVDDFLGIITSEQFKLYTPLSNALRKQYIDEVMEIWSTKDNPIRLYY
ncbi:hypothetical protein [Paenibacillus ihuae]|uniref:hypothetical protein n=1 Tax=Paenibacillus ihuae TaxID=1232431 RepID=UPI0006D53ADE|nr:hypothetical protein [Paenibacillus ihuae]